MIHGHRTRAMRVRACSGEWRPTQLSGCALWLRADKGVTLNGSTVSAWANQGTAGGSFTQGSGPAQPTYSAAGGPNSKPTLTFDGGDSLASTLAASAWAFLHNSSAVFVVFKPTTNVSAGSSFFCLLSTCASGATDRGVAMGWDNRGTLTRDDAFAYSASNGTAYTTSGVASNLSFPYNGTSVAEVVFDYGAAGNDLAILANGTAVHSSESTAAPSGSAPQSTLIVGRLAGFTFNFIGDISEVIAFDRAPTAADRNTVRRYLSNRYAITVS